VGWSPNGLLLRALEGLLARGARLGEPPTQRLESTASMSLRLESSCAQAIISRIKSAEKALRRSGRSSVTLAMRPENSLRSCRYMLTLC
jgi:hypothetical protein